IVSLQNEDGSFSGDEWGETDTRFVFCAVLCLSLLRRLDDKRLNLDKAIEYIVRCRNFDGGFGSSPGGESHSAQVYVCVGTLTILNALHHVDADQLGWWLSERQLKNGGLNGRPEKLEDVCYSWWVLSSLSMIKRLHWIDADKLAHFILTAQDTETGGFSDRPGNMVDVYHTNFGLAGLSLLGYPGLAPVDPVYCMPRTVIQRLGLGEKYQVLLPSSLYSSLFQQLPPPFLTIHHIFKHTMSSTPKPAKQPKQSKESTEPGTPHETDASPANASSVLTLRTTMALVLVVCLAIQQLAPSAFLAALFGTGNTDTASPTWTNTAKDATRGGGDGGDSRGGGGEGSSTWAARPSVKPIMFGTPDPQAFSAPPRFTSGSSSKGQGEERRRRSDSPFRDFFNQSEDDQPTPEASCTRYHCRETGACVERPIDCPCQYEQDTKCQRGDWYSCHRGPYDCSASS
ncbi:hypothetical protein DFQ27_006030, partial [Actinomortierella ambigua]